MRKHRFLIYAALIMSMIWPYARAQEHAPEHAPKYRMELVHIFESGKAEFIFVIGNSGFKSVEALRQFVDSLPAGSTIEWAPGCVRLGDEPLLSSEVEMNSFREFCDLRGINFVLIPSG